MKFGILVARDFPGYKTLHVEADDELHALRVLEDRVAKGEMTLNDGTPFEPEWGGSDSESDRVVGVTGPDGVFAPVAPGKVVLARRDGEATQAAMPQATPRVKYVELTVSAEYYDQVHTVFEAMEMGAEVGYSTATSHAELLELLKRLDGYSVFDQTGTECAQDFVDLKRDCLLALQKEQSVRRPLSALAVAPTALPNRSLDGPAAVADRQRSLLIDMEAMLAQATAPGGIGAHEFTRLGGWRDKAAQLVQRSQELQKEAGHDR